MSEDVRPEVDEHGVGLCSDRCPSHDGKRCEVLGRRPGHVCEPWARRAVAELRKANGSGVVADVPRSSYSVCRQFGLDPAREREGLQREGRVASALGGRVEITGPIEGGRGVMTREEALALEAGAELDWQVIRRLFGPAGEPLEPPPFSAGLAAAFILVDWLARRDVRLHLDDCRGANFTSPGWWASFGLPDGRDAGMMVADTAPLAICRAFFCVPDRFLR